MLLLRSTIPYGRGRTNVILGSAAERGDSFLDMKLHDILKAIHDVVGFDLQL